MHTDHFDHAVDHLFRLEGGFVNDPADPGGPTKYGISKRSYPDLDVALITREQAVKIYRRDYWERNSYDCFSHKETAVKMLDLAVNLGSRRANRLLQIAVNLTADNGLYMSDHALDAAVDTRTTAKGRVLWTDGLVGPITLTAVNDHPCPSFLLSVLRLLAVRYYTGLASARFTLGWVRRALG